MRRLRVAAAVVLNGGELLMTQRPPGGPVGLQWEFPGGKIERGETVEQALEREIREELGVRATPLEVMGTARHAYPHGLRVEITFVRCTLDSHDFRFSDEVHAARWSRPEDVDLAQVLAADRDFLVRLGARPASPRAGRSS